MTFKMINLGSLFFLFPFIVGISSCGNLQNRSPQSESTVSIFSPKVNAEKQEVKKFSVAFLKKQYIKILLGKHGDLKQVSKGDCKAFTAEDEIYCTSNDCKAILKKQPTFCENNNSDCKALLDDNWQLCQSDSCKAVLKDNITECNEKNFHCKSLFTPALCKTSDCEAVLKEFTYKCESPFCKGILKENPTECD